MRPRPVQLTTKEHAALVHQMSRGQASMDEETRAAIAAKLAAAVGERREPKIGVSIKDAVAALERVLGTGTVALPPHADDGFYARMTALVKRNGLLAGDFIRMAEVLRQRGWAPPYSFERTVQAADRLLAEHATGAGGLSMTAMRGRPVDLDDL